LSAALFVWTSAAYGQMEQKEPHIGYLYPAGGQRGTVMEVWVGGQALRGAREVVVSGDGVQAKVVRLVRPIRNLNGDQRHELGRQLKEAAQKRLSEMSPEERRVLVLPRELALPKAAIAAGKPPKSDPKKATAAPAGKKVEKNAGTDGKPGEKKSEKDTVDLSKLPDHPWLQNIDQKSLKELARLANDLLNTKKRQPNMQIAETVVLEVTIAPDAKPGSRDIRILGADGLTNPMCFEVGLFPEMRESEPNDPYTGFQFPNEVVSDLPAVFNGQVGPGDVDRLRFRAAQGQQLVVETKARELAPYLADAVPGWFQATLAIYDAQGHEIAFADDYRFNPDPVLYYKIPRDGEYALEIRDAIYRGREDFVYRITVGEFPYITQAFPLGAQTDDRAAAKVSGWNLPATKVPLDTSPGALIRNESVVREDGFSTNPFAYIVDTLPEHKEKEPNNTNADAQAIKLPIIVNGRIEEKTDADVFRFDGRKGDRVVAEVMARRLYSPLDSLLTLTDSTGKVVAWNDDFEDKGVGWCTHHADSYLAAELPADGSYCVAVSDAQHEGGPAWAYCLRVSAPRPDFALRVTPSSINIPASRIAPICVHALRKDGFSGEIEVVLKNAPSGFVLSGGRIPAGKDCVRMTLSMSGPGTPDSIPLALEGRAVIDGETAIRPVVAADDMMQAFFYRHLAPTHALLAAMKQPKSRGVPVELTVAGPVQIPVGGAVDVDIDDVPLPSNFTNVQLELSEPPAGITLQDLVVKSKHITFRLVANADAAKPGTADNLIIHASAESTPRDAKAPKPKKQTQRVSLGILPALAIQVTE